MIQEVLNGKASTNTLPRAEGLREAVANLLPEQGDSVILKKDNVVIASGVLEGEFELGQNLQVPALKKGDFYASTPIKSIQPLNAGGFRVTSTSGEEYELILTGKAG